MNISRQLWRSACFAAALAAAPLLHAQTDGAANGEGASSGTASASAGAPESAGTRQLDRVIAIVDDDVILASELNDAVQRAELNARRAKRDMPPADQFRRQVFDQLVLDSLQLQIATRAGVRISDSELNDAMERVARQNNMTLDQFSQALTKDGLPYAVAREQLRREMLIQRVQQGSVNEHVQITDQEISSFLNSAEGKSLTAPQYRVLHALIPTSEHADNAQLKQFAEQLNARLRAGEDFNKVIATPGPVKVQGGDLGWRSDDGLPSLLASVVPTLKAGQVADPIVSSAGFHLVKLADVRGKGEVIQQTKARHILLKPSAIRSDEQCKALAADLRQRVIGGADFGQLARQYSEDIGSAMEGGELGWTSPGQLVDAFQKAMDNTTPGSISEPFHSRYGWHIVMVEERRQQDVTTELKQNMARNYLHEKKYQEELDGWLRKIRDEAFVDIKKL